MAQVSALLLHSMLVCLAYVYIHVQVAIILCSWLFIITGMVLLTCFGLVGLGYVGLGGTIFVLRIIITMSCSLCGLGEGLYTTYGLLCVLSIVPP